MIAPNTLAYDPDKDAEIILIRLVQLDPTSRQKLSPAYGLLKSQLLESGWSEQRLCRALTILTREKDRRLWVGKSSKSASLSSQSMKGHCAYCRAVCKNLTRDHVVPRCQGGSQLGHKNIVLSCKSCNASKGGRTPEQWANDILSYRTPVRRIPLWQRIRLAVNVVFGSKVSNSGRKATNGKA